MWQNLLTKKRRKKTDISFKKVISKFVFLCAATAVVQTTIPIPIFSQIFGTSLSQTNASPKVSAMSLKASCSEVTYAITIDDVKDFSANEYCLMLLEEGNDSEEYITSIPKKIKDSHKVVLLASDSKGSFKKYISVAGEKWIGSKKKKN